MFYIEKACPDCYSEYDLQKKGDFFHERHRRFYTRSSNETINLFCPAPLQSSVLYIRIRLRRFPLLFHQAFSLYELYTEYLFGRFSFLSLPCHNIPFFLHIFVSHVFR